MQEIRGIERHWTMQLNRVGYDLSVQSAQHFKTIRFIFRICDLENKNVIDVLIENGASLENTTSPDVLFWAFKQSKV